MKFKVNDRIIHISTNRVGTVLSIRGSHLMNVQFDDENGATVCDNSERYFKLAYELPNAEEKAEWADIWDKGSE